MDPHTVTESKRPLELIKREIKAIQASSECRYIVQYYGASLSAIDCWICMEMMDTSLHDLCKKVYEKQQIVPEEMIGFCAVSVLSALEHLKSTKSIIHRDVKPKNILLDKKGNIKLCDFGLTGILINSLVNSCVGTMFYMAPERLGEPAGTPYDARSDVWSLGITLLEIAIGKIPYDFGKFKLFEAMSIIKKSPAPTLPEGNPYSRDLNRFLSKCLKKNVEDRPRHTELMEDAFYVQHQQREDASQITADFVQRFLV